MGWITAGDRPLAAHPEILVMLRRAVADAPSDSRRRRALARELFALGHHRAAAQAFAIVLDSEGDLGEDWSSLVLATLDGEGFDSALAIVERWGAEGEFAWHYTRGCALREAGNIDAAGRELRRAIALGDPDHDATRALLRMHAERSDGARLLAACDDLAAKTQQLGLTLGYRALALSLLGRTAEATALVDLDAGTMRFGFEPPPGVTLAAFNRALADAILADQPPHAADRDILINHAIDLPQSAEFAALKDFVRTCYDRYRAAMAERPAASFMPRIEGGTRLDFGAVTVRRGGRNGQHVHPAAWLTGVYHAHVPAPLAGDAGSLVTGVCDEIAPGHRACWGSRVLPAIPGTLTIFPAHYFHDVRPTGVEERRVVVVSDLIPDR